MDETPKIHATALWYDYEKNCGQQRNLDIILNHHNPNNFMVDLDVPVPAPSKVTISIQIEKLNDAH